METAVRKATRLDYTPPKQKHLSTLVSLTFHNPALIGEMLDLLERRHRENSWIISFKVLVIIHVLIRQGNGERALTYVESHPACLDTTRLREKSSGVIHIQNIYLYTAYLQQKVAAFREARVDHVKATATNKTSRLRRLSINDGLLKETLVLQKLIASLLKCKFVLEDVDNTISLYAFKLVVEDLLTLFQAMNEGIVNILEHYFAMGKADARLSLEIYRRFARQTEEVTAFLDRARKYQAEMQINIPVAKHAPLSLAAALEEYLNDLDNGTITAKTTTKPATTTSNAQKATPVPQAQQPKELIDFFASLDNDPALGAPAASPATTPQPMAHNPFRATMMAPATTTTSALVPSSSTTSAGVPTSSVMQDLASLSAPSTMNPMLGFNAMMMNQAPQQPAPSSLLALPPPTSSASSPSPLMIMPSVSTSSSNANPFRATMFGAPAAAAASSQTMQSQQPSFLSSSPMLPQPTGLNPSFATSSASSPSMNTSNPFSMGQSTTTAIPASMPALQTPQMTGFNPFAAANPMQPQQPAASTNPWGSPSVF
ncbi:ANTH domain-containing protein [Gongronella butleri]|nr:ANTH domain-containing protein [Gongronella butleri]